MRERVRIEARKWAAGNVQGGIVGGPVKSKKDRKKQLAEFLIKCRDAGKTIDDVIDELNKDEDNESGI